MKFFKKDLFNFKFFKSTVLILLILTSKPVLAYRPLTGEKPVVTNLKATKDVPTRALLPPSAPNACTYMPGDGDGGHCDGNHL